MKTDDMIERLVAEARRQSGESEKHRLAMMDASRRRQEAIFSLHALGLSVRQIATRLGCSAGVVQAALQTAKGRRPVLERREERIPYELHVQLGLVLADQEERVRKLGRENLQRMRKTKRNPVAERWLDEWDKALGLPSRELAKRVLAVDELSAEMRQVSPFAGALSDEERVLAIQRARALAPQ